MGEDELTQEIDTLLDNNPNQDKPIKRRRQKYKDVCKRVLRGDMSNNTPLIQALFPDDDTPITHLTLKTYYWYERDYHMAKLLTLQQYAQNKAQYEQEPTISDDKIKTNISQNNTYKDIQYLTIIGCSKDKEYIKSTEIRLTKDNLTDEDYEYLNTTHVINGDLLYQLKIRYKIDTAKVFSMTTMSKDNYYQDREKLMWMAYNQLSTYNDKQKDGYYIATKLGHTHMFQKRELISRGRAKRKRILNYLVKDYNQHKDLYDNTFNIDAENAQQDFETWDWVW